MDFDLTDAQRALRDKASELAAREISPHAAAVDREQRFPREAVAHLGKLGALGISVPAAWGGLGLDAVAASLVIEELASACASTAAVVGLHNFLVCEPLAHFGTDAQRKTWLRALASGSKLGSFALTEPDGADADVLETVAQQEAGGWVLRGTKSFVTPSPYAQVALVIAGLRTGDHAGPAAFIVPTDALGVSFGPAYQTMGLRGALRSTMTLDDVRLPAGALLGSEKAGPEILRFAREGGSVVAAALALGIGRAAFAAATQYALSRRTNGQSISDHQTVQFKIADMSTYLDAARLLTWRAAASRAAGASMGAQASMAKLIASEAATRVASDAVQILGGNGCLTDYPVERHFRDAKVCEIYEGSSEIHRLGIASNLLKE